MVTNSAPNRRYTPGLRDQSSPPTSHGGRQAMSISFKKTLLALAGILSIGVLSPVSIALAQAPQASAPSSVLPTGGGAALLDLSDTVFLLLDHQAGLFQTVKDITVAELRSNTVML